MCIVDADRQLLRSVVDAYMESEHSYLFDEQVIAYTTHKDGKAQVILVSLRLSHEQYKQPSSTSNPKQHVKYKHRSRKLIVFMKPKTMAMQRTLIFHTLKAQQT